MKRVLLVLVIALAAVGCGSDEPGPPLSAADYGAQGNAVCDKMNADLDRLSAKFSSDMSPEQQRDLSIEANTISRDAINELFTLTPPASLETQRQLLLDLAEERRELIDRMNNGENLVDRINEVNLDFEIEAATVWPSCSRQ